MVAGAVVAGLTDLTYSLPGYLWVSVCAVSTAVYLLLIRLLKDRTGERPRKLLGSPNPHWQAGSGLPGDVSLCFQPHGSGVQAKPPPHTPMMHLGILRPLP